MYKTFVKKAFPLIREYLMIALGLLLYACAWKSVLFAHQIVGGGATGVSAIIYYATGFPVWALYLIINTVLLLFAIKILDLAFSIRTIYGVIVLTLWFAVIPEAPIGTFLAVTDNFLACVIGGLMWGAGMGIVFIYNGSSGGTDIIVKVLNKYKNITLGRSLLYCDVLIVSSSYFLQEDSENGLKFIVYGLCSLTIAVLTLDMVVNGVRQSVQFFIFSKRHTEIANAISTEVKRGVTILDGTGWHSKEPIKVVTVLARKNESVKIFRLVKNIDPNAFVSQSSAIGVYGEGFDQMIVNK